MKAEKSHLLVIILVAISVAFIFSVASAGHLSDSHNITVLDDRGDVILLNFGLIDYEIKDIQVNGEECSYIKMSNAASSMEKGSPDLPYISRSVLIPDDAEMELEIVDVSYKELSVKKIIPSRGAISRSQNPEDIPYEFGDIYEEDVWYPSAVARMGMPYILRDCRGLVVYFQPFLYNCVQGTLKVAEEITIKLKRVGSSYEDRSIKHIKSSRSFEHIYGNHFINYSYSGRYGRYQAVADEGNLIVITTSDYRSAVEPFVEWKRRKGFTTDLYIYPTETGGVGADSIKSFIQDLYDDPDKGVTFILIVGDADDVPPALGTKGNVVGKESDPSYTLLAGSDQYADAMIGRFSVENPTQAQTVVNKSIWYEKSPCVSGHWYDKACGIAGPEFQDGGPKDWERMNELRDMMVNYNYTEFTEVYGPKNHDLIVSELSEAVNQGRGWVNFIGHGKITKWCWKQRDWVDAFVNGDVGNLTNSNMTPVVISVACQVGKFDGHTCFSEAWQRHGAPDDPKGSVVFMGSSTNQKWVPPCVGQKEMISHLVNENYSTVGGIVFNGGMKMIDDYPEDWEYGPQTFQSWHLFGDPTLATWTDVPHDLTVVHDSVILLGAESYSLQVSEDGALVSLVKNGEILGTAISSGGSATVDFDSPIDTYGAVQVTVTKHNFRPYIACAIVLDPDSNPEFLLTANDQHTIDVRFSCGVGTFTPALSVGEDLGVNYGEFAIADFSGDEKLDFIASTNENPSRLYMFTRTGPNSFHQSENPIKTLDNDPIAPDYGLGLIAADLNNDGHMDFLENINHDFGGNKYWIAKGNVYLNNGTGDFTKVANAFDFTSIYTGWTLGMSSTVVDADGDGYPDMLASEQSSGAALSSKVYLLKGNGDGTFQQPVHVFTTDLHPATHMTLGDFNNDGKVDAIVGQDDDGDPGAAFLFSGHGDGTFEQTGIEAFDTRSDIESGSNQPGSGKFQAYDADMDGILDIITAHKKKGIDDPDESATLVFLKGRGDGTFEDDDRQVIESDIIYRTAFQAPLTSILLVNNMVDFIPMRPYTTIPFTKDYQPSKCGCPDGYAGLFTFQAMLENTSNTSFTDLTVKVHTLTNENLLVLARGNSLPEDFVGAETGGEGALWILPASGNYDGRILYQGPSKAALPRFGICLQEIKRFGFYVDVLGKVQ